MSTTTEKTEKERLLEDFERLPLALQRRLGALARQWTSPGRGVPLKELKPLLGSIDTESAREMEAAVEGSCERVDLSEW